MRNAKVWLVGWLAAAVVLGPAAGAWANTWVDVQLPYDQFGHLWNTHNGKSPTDPDDPGTWKGWCAPTAIANSFKFLETRYPTMYDQKLTGGDLLATREALRLGWDSRAGTGGGNVKDVWQAKVYWVEDHAPNTTIFDGMMYYPGEDLSTWHGGGVLENAHPSFDFLWGELDHKEDIELGFWWEMVVDGKKKAVAHMVTLTSLKFCDDGDGIWEPATEQARLDFIDPNNPTGLTWEDLTLSGDGALTFQYNHGGNDYLATINGAFTESPIPEPLTMAGLLLGVGCLARYVHRQRGRSER